MSIRARLTLLYTGLLAATLVGFGVVLYLTVASSTRSFMENTLAVEMRQLVAANTEPLLYIQTAEPSLASSETYWQACDSNGNVMGRADNLREHTLPLSEGGLHSVQSGDSVYEVAQVDGVPLLIYSQPIATEGSQIGILQVARSIAEQEHALRTLQVYLIAGGLLTLGIAVICGWLIAKASLRPIDHLTNTARLIGSERDFARRVEYQGPQDEVGRLATTFNSMLAALETAYRQVAQSLEAQRTFIADASHELRTPLTTVRGNLALLQRNPPIAPEDRTAVLSDIVDENERLIRLVNDLMTLARADYTPSITLEPVPLAPLFAEVERQVGSMESACTFDVARAPNVDVLAQRDMLKQILLILLDNACKYTPANGRIALSAEQVGSQIAIKVRDTGNGISEKHLPHVFQRFYRADQSRSGNGHGLGLAIAKALTEKQRGTIEVESAPGVGTTFTITLDLAAQPAPASLPLNDQLKPAQAY